MKDFVSKNQGNSRYLKTNLAAGTTWDDALASMRAGTFPIDLNGVNSAGYTQLGTALNKANLLTDATASALELSQSDPTVNDALNALASRVRAQVKSYVGDGTYGSGNACSLTFDYAPMFVIYIGYKTSSVDYVNNAAAAITLMSFIGTSYSRQDVFGTSSVQAKISSDGKTISWYSSSTAAAQLNGNGNTYYFIAIG